MSSSDKKFEYAPAPESTAIASISSEYGLFINGKFQAPHSKKKFEALTLPQKKLSPRLPLQMKSM